MDVNGHAVRLHGRITGVNNTNIALRAAIMTGAEIDVDDPSPVDLNIDRVTYHARSAAGDFSRGPKFAPVLDKLCGCLLSLFDSSEIFAPLIMRGLSICERNRGDPDHARPEGLGLRFIQPC